MCGIAGIITKGEIPDSRIHETINCLKHRGPDGNGFLKKKLNNNWNIILIHTRLSIIDLKKRSNQPMHVGKGDLIFNGEIYNYKEIKSIFLKNKDWDTESDTEVLGNLLSEKGIEGLSECEGMWALAWLDNISQNLFISRDRFGEKPLYVYHLLDGGIIFSSEPKAIFKLLGQNPSINKNQIKRFIVNGYKSLYKSKETFFHGLEELPPGFVGQWDPINGYKQWKWWIPNFNNCDHDLTLEEAILGTRERLRNSLEIRLRADVPIAFCLSGGIDSNVLSSIAKNIFNKDIHCFTVLNEDERYEEKEMIDIAVKRLGVRHTGIPVLKKNFIENLKEIIFFHDAPVFTLSSYAQWQLMKSISSFNYKVSISGNGADELFSGYYDHHNAYLEYLWSNKKELHLSAINNWKNSAGKYVRNPFLVDPNYFIKSPLSRDHIYLDSKEMSSYLKDDFYESFSEEVICKNILRNRMANELNSEVVPVLLHEEDLNAMSCSIENRSPYLDSQLFNWSTKIPTEYLVQEGLAKFILRKSFEDIVPKEILFNKRKVGFNIPIDSYLDFNDKKTTDVFLDQNSLIMDLVNREKLEKALIPKERRSNQESKFLFNFISSKIFIDQFS